jgi:hypothetical protein
MLEVAILVLLVAAGVALRLSLRDLPNFSPVAALALFAGYYFRSATFALLVPLGVLTASDYVLGGYEGTVMIAVYGALAAPVAMRRIVRRSCAAARGWQRPLVAAGGILGCSLGASVAFFACSNLAVWLSTGMYMHSLRGLSACYLQALPFFRYTVAGDLVFATALFGGHAALRTLGVWLATRAAAVRLADA